jgi:predicted nucleotidyltransferase
MNPELVAPTVDKRKRIPASVIRAAVRHIAREFHPQKIILFGSYARGKPRPESDVDLLVVMDTKLRGMDQALNIRRNLGVMFGMDLLVYTPKRLEQRLKWGDSFLQEIMETGKVLYESTDSGMDRKSGRRLYGSGTRITRAQKPKL